MRQPSSSTRFDFGDSAGGQRVEKESALRLLTRVVDAGLAGVILLSPWFMGGRHPLGEFVLIALSTVTSVAWLLRQAVVRHNAFWRRSAGDYLLLGGIALALLQLTPLPHAVFEFLSPHTHALLELWNATDAATPSLGTWNIVSMTPDATRGSLTMLLCYAMLFLVSVQRIERIHDVERLLRLLAFSAVLQATVGVAQYLAGNGKFLWVYEHPFRDTYDAVKGPFINKNHFAHLLALGLAPLVWLLQQAMQNRAETEPGGFSRRPASSTSNWSAASVLVGLGIVLFAGTMTLSRGGIVALALAVLICTAIMYRGGFVSRRLAVGMLTVCLLGGTSLTIHGYERVASRLVDFTAGSINQLDHNAARRDLWKADAQGVADYWRLGAGLGSHRDVYPLYFQGSWDNEFTHAENGYLQVALEAGVPGLLLLLLGIVCSGRWCLHGLRSNLSHTRVFLAAAAVSAALAVSVLHSLCDFVWYIPSLMAITTILVACACRLAQLANAEDHATPAAWCVPRALWLGAAATIGLACAWTLYDRGCAALAAPHWDQYLAYSLSDESKLNEAVPDDVVEHLQNVLYWTPADARAQIRMSDICLRQFGRLQQQSENPMTISDVSDAAMQSRAQFTSRADLDRWLTRAVGDNRRYLDLALHHAHRGLALGPLQGGGYTNLAQLCFLEGAQIPARQAYVRQALQTRPHDGKVLMVAGSEAFRDGQFDLGLDYWRQSFQSGGESRAALIDSLARQRVPVEYLIKEFQPDLAAVRMIDAKYSASFEPAQLRPLLVLYGQLGEAAAEQAEAASATSLWMELRGVYRRLANDKLELSCLRKAAQASPNDFAVRYQLAECLFTQAKYAEAQREFAWCQQRQPEDKNLSARVAQAAREQVRQVNYQAEAVQTQRR